MEKKQLKGSIKPWQVVLFLLVAAGAALVAYNPNFAIGYIANNKQVPLLVVGFACLAFGAYQLKTKSLLIQSAKKLGTDEEKTAHDDYVQWAVSSAVAILVGIYVIFTVLVGKTTL